MPRDVEYEEHPHGRVTYGTNAQKSYLLGDRCILGDRGTVATIMRAMHLPENTIVDTDLHYKCPGCNKSKAQQEQEEDEWDF